MESGVLFACRTGYVCHVCANYLMGRRLTGCPGYYHRTYTVWLCCSVVPCAAVGNGPKLILITLSSLMVQTLHRRLAQSDRVFVFASPLPQKKKRKKTL